MFWDFSGSEEALAFAFFPGLWTSSPQAENIGTLRGSAWPACVSAAHVVPVSRGREKPRLQACQSGPFPPALNPFQICILL